MCSVSLSLLASLASLLSLLAPLSLLSPLSPSASLSCRKSVPKVRTRLARVLTR
jgi:hypothetical protein